MPGTESPCAQLRTPARVRFPSGVLALSPAGAPLTRWPSLDREVICCPQAAGCGVLLPLRARHRVAGFGVSGAGSRPVREWGARSIPGGRATRSMAIAQLSGDLSVPKPLGAEFCSRFVPGTESPCAQLRTPARARFPSGVLAPSPASAPLTPWPSLDLAVACLSPSRRARSSTPTPRPAPESLAVELRTAARVQSRAGARPVPSGHSAHPADNARSGGGLSVPKPLGVESHSHSAPGTWFPSRRAQSFEHWLASGSRVGRSLHPR